MRLAPFEVGLGLVYDGDLLRGSSLQRKPR